MAVDSEAKRSPWLAGGDQLQATPPLIDDGELLDHIPVFRGQQPVVHNRFAFARFFEFRSADGEVRNLHGQRAAFASAEFFLGLTEGLSAALGRQTAAEILYGAGRDWGFADIERFRPRVQAEFGCELRAIPVGFLLETWWSSLAAGGWGGWTQDCSDFDQAEIRITVVGSPFAKARDETGHAACHVYAGLFSAALSELAQRDLAGAELHCAGSGPGPCQFLVAGEARIEELRSMPGAGDCKTAPTTRAGER